MKRFLFVVGLALMSHAAVAEEDCGCGGTPAAAVSSTPLVLAPPTEKVLLRLKLTPGLKFSQTIVAKERSTSISKLMRVTAIQETYLSTDNEVIEVSADGAHVIRSSVRDARIKMSMQDEKGKPFGSMNFFGVSPTKLFAGVKGLALTIRYSSRGSSYHRLDSNPL